MLYAFGDYVLDTQQILLFRAGQSMRLRPQVFQLLTFLLEHRDRVLSKEELCQHLWPEQYIGDARLESVMRAVRQAIGDNGREQRCIQTLHGHGYRFVAAVVAQQEADSESPALSPRESGRAPAAPPAFPPPVEAVPVPVESRPLAHLPMEPRIACSHCQAEQPSSARFCAGCGGVLGRLCPGCGAVLPSLAQFCSACGRRLTLSGAMLASTGLAAAPEPALDRIEQRGPAAATAEGAGAERRRLTVLCCDLVAATALATQLDPEAFREVIRTYHATCATVVARYEGYIAEYLGARLLIYFGYPRAHEDAAQRAVRTGLALVEAVHRLGQQGLPSGALARAVPLQVRVGLHTGLVVIDKVGDEARQTWFALGEVPNLATALQSLAAPQTVLLSAATWRLIDGWFVGHPLGEQALAGFPQAVTVYQVLRESGIRSRLEATGTYGLTPLIGREPEVALLQERWTQATEGLGQVVLISGEPGIGKSRLVQVLQTHIAPQAFSSPSSAGCPAPNCHRWRTGAAGGGLPVARGDTGGWWKMFKFPILTTASPRRSGGGKYGRGLVR